MTENIQTNNFIYCFSYDNNESELCKLESRHIFNKEEKNKQLFSDIKAEPSSSPFIKKRLEITIASDSYSKLLKAIKKERICIDGFKVEYIVLEGDTTEYDTRLRKLKDIGWSIEGDPDYYKPVITYAICFHEDMWYFGVLVKNGFRWRNHKQKPYSYSNSININIAKALINIAAEGDKNKKLLDACCGVGTIMLEGCFSGYNIEGCDSNWKVCKQAKENLSHFNYITNVYRSDIKDISKKYDAAIIDLPYNLFSYSDDNDAKHIIESTVRITNRIIIVSTTDIEQIISNAGLTLTDLCSVGKSGKRSFSRKIWVCEKATAIPV